jgi:predicted RNase H-like nuclease (RuvC/YqgF family)
MSSTKIYPTMTEARRAGRIDLALQRLERDKEVYEDELRTYEQRLASGTGEEHEIRHLQNQISETKLALQDVQKRMEGYSRDKTEL